ncbi:family 43 glycosylhydrolase [Streptomyces sp. NPDC058656]|uniref:family 43 glycosylhydrolase n=1 Tax=unclassified Streptomyces TaxID=2593676 RepID=UPI00366194EA
MTKYSTIRPGREWLDSSGARIQAHAGSMHYEEGVFYWYGENKEKTGPGTGVWHWGVRCYSSTDLYNWEDRGLIIAPDLDDSESPLHPAQLTDRPHILRNPRTGQYVCWLKTMGPANMQTSSVLVADDFLGPYTLIRRGLRPLSMSAGDFDLVVDPTDGKGYYYFERVHSELICADLSDDFTDVTGYYSTHFPQPGPPDVREAPAHFVRGGRHYLVTSGTTGYFPNRSELAVAPSYHGPWRVLGDPHPADKSHTSYRSQISCVFPHPHKPDLYIAMADRWLPSLSEAESDISAATGPESVSAKVAALLYGDIRETDTAHADYVWLPLRFDGEMAYLDWHDEWRIEDF